MEKRRRNILDGVQLAADNEQCNASSASIASVVSNTPDTPLLPPTDTHDLTHRLAPEEALVHIIKGLTGTGLLSLPAAFANSGLYMGLVSLVIICFLDTYCMRLLAISADYYRKRFNRPSLDYANVMRLAVEMGAPAYRRFGYAAKLIVNVQIFVASYGTCSIYFVFLAENTRSVMSSWSEKQSWSTAIYITMWLLPCLMLCMIRELKTLAIPALLADIVYVLAFIATFQYLLYDLPDSKRLPTATDIHGIALALGSIMFAFEGVCLILPIVNQIEDRRLFIKSNGVLNTGCVLVTVIYICVGFYGYIKFGAQVEDTITLNLPTTWFYDLVRLGYVFAVFVTFAIQFYVPTERIEKWISRKVWRGQNRRQAMVKIGARIGIVLITYAIALLVPHLNLIISLIGAYGSSSLAILFPAIIDLLTEKAQNGTISTATVLKDVTLIVIGVVAIVVGTYASLAAIVSTFSLQ